MVEQGSQGNTNSSLAGTGSVAGAAVSASGTTPISDPDQAGPSRALESMGGHISQRWYEFTTGEPEIDRYG